MTFDHIMEEIEIAKYLKNTTYTVGRKGYNSVNMLKTILFGFMDKGYISLRELEDECKVNIRYMYLMEYETPSYKTFGNFINDNLTADAKKGFKFDENVKGINDKGGFEVPAGRDVFINMCCKSNGFDCSAKNDMDLFTIQNGASLELQQAKISGSNGKFVIPDNAKNTTLKLKYVEIYGPSSPFADCNPCISISKKAENTKIDLSWTEFNGEYGSRIQNDGKNTKINEWYVTRTWEPEVHGKEYWGT